MWTSSTCRSTSCKMLHVPWLLIVWLQVHSSPKDQLMLQHYLIANSYSVTEYQGQTENFFCDGSELCLTLSRQSPRWNTALLRYIKEMNACTLAHLVTSLSSCHHWTGLRCVCSSNKVDQLKPSLSYPCLLLSFFFCSPMGRGQVIITHSLFLQFQRFEMKDDSYWVLSDPFVARNKEWLVFLKGLWICVTGDGIMSWTTL